jgi:hypothetical protein
MADQAMYLAEIPKNLEHPEWESDKRMHHRMVKSFDGQE